MRNRWCGCVLIFFVLSGCSSSATEAERESPTSVSSSDENLPADWEFPEVGATTAAVLNPDEECRNGGVVHAFGASWGVAGLIPLELADSGPLEGSVWFGNLEDSYFLVDGLAVPITYSAEIGQECNGWSTDDPSGDE